MAEMLSVEGLKDAKAALDALTKDMRRKVVRGALRDAARPFVQAARANAPVLTGLMRKRIGTFTSKLKRGQNGEIGVYVKPRASNAARRAKNRALDPFYYRFQEAGFHAVGRRKVKGGRRARAANLAASGARFIPGKMFLGRAFASQQRRALEIFQSAVKKRIDLANTRK
jgi:HK97 gp10 family phage protein